MMSVLRGSALQPKRELENQVGVFSIKALDVTNIFLCLVPSSGPNHVEANATSSTTIVVKWGDVPKGNENGVIEGFKVFYGALPKVPFKVLIFL
jgi:hypothetical protein